MNRNFSGIRGVMTGVSAALALGLVTGCDGDGAEAEGIEIAGAWTSDFGDETITDTTWTNYAVLTVIEFDNATRTAILQNPDDDDWNPSAFSKVVWTPIEADAFHYCTATFGHETLDEARAASLEGVDADDLDGEGCGGFPWSFLTRKE